MRNLEQTKNIAISSSGDGGLVKKHLVCKHKELSYLQHPGKELGTVECICNLIIEKQGQGGAYVSWPAILN